MKIDTQQYCGNRELYKVGELASKIIYSMQSTGQVYLHTAEPFSSYDNGLFALLDELCHYWQWNASSITVASSNRLQTHPAYNTIWLDLFLPAAWFNATRPVLSWSGEKYYGMFIGRANASRIYATHLHDKFEYKQQGLTSFNDNLLQFMNHPELIDYFFHSNQTYAEMCLISPYSDISVITKPPVMPAEQAMVPWPLVYQKIAIEIICETSTTANCSATSSEKTLQALYFKKPFLLIGPPENLKFLRSEGYRTFSEFIPEDYDQLEGIPRVIRIFEILHQLIKSGQIHILEAQCSDILNHNHNVVKKRVAAYKKINYQNLIGETIE